jgi:hypothetical protein
MQLTDEDRSWFTTLDTRVRAHGMAIGPFEGEKANYIEQAKKLLELERRLEKLEKASEPGTATIPTIRHAAVGIAGTAEERAPAAKPPDPTAKTAWTIR